jgi:hypothetical protein
MASSANLLVQRLEEALHQGLKVHIETADSIYKGIPVQMDEDFVEIVTLWTKKQDEEKTHHRSHRVIRIEVIETVGCDPEDWDCERFDALIIEEE